MWVQRMKLRSSTKTTSPSLWPPQMNLHLVILSPQNLAETEDGKEGGERILKVEIDFQDYFQV